MDSQAWSMAQTSPQMRLETVEPPHLSDDVRTNVNTCDVGLACSQKSNRPASAGRHINALLARQQASGAAPTAQLRRRAGGTQAERRYWAGPCGLTET